MSFFSQDNAIMEIEVILYDLDQLPKQKVQYWKHRLSKQVKLAAKLEFKNNQVELHIVDENAHVFKLSGFNLQCETNLMLQGKDPVGIIQYKSKFLIDDQFNDYNELNQQFNRLQNDDKQQRNVEEDEAPNEQVFTKNRFQQYHLQFDKKQDDIKTLAGLDEYDRQNLKLKLIHHLQEFGEGISINQLQSVKQFRFQKTDLQKLLEEMTEKRKVKNETRYQLKANYKK